MKSLITIGVLLGAVLAVPAPADATTRSHGCKVVSVTSVVQSRNIDGVVVAIVNGKPVFGHGIQHRTATTTATKCKGRTSAATTYTTWS